MSPPGNSPHHYIAIIIKMIAQLEQLIADTNVAALRNPQARKALRDMGWQLQALQFARDQLCNKYGIVEFAPEGLPETKQ